VVHFNLMVNGGASADPADAPGTANLEQGMLGEGTTTRDSLKIAEDLESLSANFNAGVDRDVAFAELDALKANLDRSLDIYADLILRPAFSQKEFERVQKQELAAIAREKVTPNSTVSRVVPQLIYGKGNPYAEFLTGTDASVSKMTREDLAKYHDTWFKPNNATLVIVGDTTLAEITPRLTQLFGSWKSGDVAAITIPQVSDPQKDEVYLIDRPGSAQSLIVTAQLAPPQSDPDALALGLVNGVFGGGFASRINMNLREDKHWSYGVSSGLRAARGQRLFMSSSPVQTDKTKESMEQLVEEFKNIVGSKPISAEEVKTQQADATLSLPGRFETVAQVSTGYSTILEYNLPEDYYNTYTEKILAITPEKMNEIAKKYIQPGHLVWLVVGDMSKVEAGIRELKIGEVHKIDADGNPVQ
jgi:zinc protease